MRLEDFAEQALTETQRILDEKQLQDCKAELTSVVKTNDLVKPGICFKRKGTNMGPNLYLDKLYKRYQDGEPLSTLVSEMIDTFLESEHQVQPDAEALDMSYDKIKDMLRVRIVDQQTNRKYLQSVLHAEIPGTGLHYIPEVRMEKEDGFWSAVVSKSIADVHNYNPSEVLATALANTLKHDPPRAFYLSNAVFASESESVNLLDEDSIDIEALVLTSKSSQFGASAILDESALAKIAASVGPFHILPSSRHEVIIMPDAVTTDEDALRSMVREANRTVVTEDEFLSDDIFAYSPSVGLRRCIEQPMMDELPECFVADRSAS